jgi:protein-(glutamine-N5) methyltransferase, release factor-specific
MTNAHDGNTIRNSLKWAIAILKKAGIEFPETDADTLLAYALSCDRACLYTNPDNIIDEADICNYSELIYKRASHVPLQYITRRVEFMSIEFAVDERVLIPRPETEILVETVLSKVNDKKFPDKNIIIMEIGTGSGNIAVSLAKNLSKVVVYTNDISQDALSLAKENIQAQGVDDKVHLLHGDFFEAFFNCVEKEHIDFIVSNPPYISESEWNELEPEVKEHEPRLALVGGEDGLYFFRKIIKDAADWLRPGGYLVIEIGETQANTIIKLMQNELLYNEIEKIKDLQGKERIISARRK